MHDAGVGVETWELYKQFAEQGKLRTRIYGMISGAGAVFDQLSNEGPINSLYDDRLALRSVKLYSDGALGSRIRYFLQCLQRVTAGTTYVFVNWHAKVSKK